MLVEEEDQAGSQLSPISNSEEEENDDSKEVEEDDEAEETVHSTTGQTKVSVACQSTSPRTRSRLINANKPTSGGHRLYGYPVSAQTGIPLPTSDPKRKNSKPIVSSVPNLCP